jgi:hypothetical protein
MCFQLYGQTPTAIISVLLLQLSRPRRRGGMASVQASDVVKYHSTLNSAPRHRECLSFLFVNRKPGRLSVAAEILLC